MPFSLTHSTKGRGGDWAMLKLLSAQVGTSALWMLSVPKAQIGCKVLNKQDDFGSLVVSQAPVAPKPMPVLPGLSLATNRPTELQCLHTIMLLQVSWQGLSLISSLSEASPGSNMHRAQAITLLFSLHSFWSFKSLPPVTNNQVSGFRPWILILCNS